MTDERFEHLAFVADVWRKRGDDRGMVELAAEARRAREEEARLREALAGLVHANEDWNASVTAIIGRQPNWSDSYLTAARSALSGGPATEPGGGGT